MRLEKKVILGITGSIAASKCYDLISRLKDAGVNLKVILTKSAPLFIDLNALREQVGADNLYGAEELFGNNHMLHIELARFAEIIMIAPAGANFIAKLSGGFADDLLSTVCLASSAELIVVPAMNQQMWANRFTQQNIANLISNEVEIFGPAYGSQACGDIGLGRMIEPSEIFERLTETKDIFAGQKILISAGPTVEQIDAVRYISNYSSGKMGIALAKVAKKMGARVTVVAGAINLMPISGVEIIAVKSSQQMLEAITKSAPHHDIFISAAAVADYRPVKTLDYKLKKDQNFLLLKLEPTVDILKEISSMPNPPFLVGFAAETDDLLTHAACKLKEKKLNMIIANDVSDGKVFGSENNQVYILSSKNAHSKFISAAPKNEIAKAILTEIAENYFPQC